MEVAIKELYTKIQSDLQMVFFTQSEESEESDIDTTTPNNPRECLMIIFNSIRDLIILKRNFFMLKDYEDFLDNTQYQEALQTLESEVRNHIKIEQQLKLFIETQQSKLEEIEKTLVLEEKSIALQIKNLESENSEFLSILRKKENEINVLKSSSEFHSKNEFLALQQQSLKDSDRIYQLEKKNKGLTDN